MKNILNFYKENELGLKWWHRLAKVLIFGSTLIIFIFSIIWFFRSFSDWNNPDPKYIYSFESKYEEAFGFIKPCTFLLENNEDSISIECGDVGEKWKGGNYGYLPDFLDRYSKSIGYKEEFISKSPLMFNNKIMGYSLNVNYELFNKKIEQGQFNNVNAKRIILLGPLMRNIGIMFLVPIFWFFLIKDVIYRSIIYIILGNKK